MKFHIENNSYGPQEMASTFVEEGQESWLLDIGQFLANWLDATQDCIIQKTSGSTGAPKEIFLEKEKMRNSALMTGRHFGFEQMEKMLLCLPAHYIAGKMMIVRALVWDLDLYCVQPKRNPLLELEKSFDFAAMIPMQVSEVLEHSLSKKQFKEIKKVLIGGAAVSALLLSKIEEQPNACYASYGMTETVSHIAIRELNGANAEEWFYPLEAIKLGQDDRNCLLIEAPLLNPKALITNDIIAFNKKGGFQVLGRWDNVINSGGVKLIVEEIEKRISPFIEFPFYLAGKADEKLGERLVLFVEGKEWEENKKTFFFEQINKVLKRYEVPKEVVFREEFIRTQSGKIKRL